MGRFLALVLTCLVSLSLVAGTAVHATEPVACIGSEVAAELGHVEGDRDEVPSDAGKATPHHHGGCQGHQIGEAVREESSPQLRIRAILPLVPNAQDRVSTPTDPAYRPPRA